jgi:hypothetical protein
MSPRQAAHRLRGTPLDPNDDKPPEQTPAGRMNALLQQARQRKQPPKSHE